MTPPPGSVSVLIPAAGAGLRLGLGPKAWLELDGRPVIDWVAAKARQLGEEILIACPAATPAPEGCIRVEGGGTRQDSVRHLAQAATRPWVLVWDAARPFGSVRLAQDVLHGAIATGAAGAFLSGGAGTVAGFQTPLAFSRKLLLDVAARAADQDWAARSTMELVLRAGHEVTRVPGEPSNIKLTTAQDWQLAQTLLGLLA
jgi:2-C-methyl-D-erythritol 4-phosphate cytidylyltransferase